MARQIWMVRHLGLFWAALAALTWSANSIRVGFGDASLTSGQLTMLGCATALGLAVARLLTALDAHRRPTNQRVASDDSFLLPMGVAFLGVGVMWALDGGGGYTTATFLLSSFVAGAIFAGGRSSAAAHERPADAAS